MDKQKAKLKFTLSCKVIREFMGKERSGVELRSSEWYAVFGHTVQCDECRAIRIKDLDELMTKLPRDK